MFMDHAGASTTAAITYEAPDRYRRGFTHIVEQNELGGPSRWSKTEAVVDLLANITGEFAATEVWRRWLSASSRH